MTARAGLLVFDDYIPSGTFGVVYAYTPDVLNDALGRYDVIACEAVLDQVTVPVTGSFMLYLQHSADNRNFVYTNGTTTPPAAPELSVALSSTSAAYFGITAYPGTFPLLGNVRFALQFGQSTAAARVKLFVTLRDLA